MKQLIERLEKLITFNELSPKTINNYLAGRQKQIDDIKAQEKELKKKKEKIKNKMSNFKQTTTVITADWDQVGWIGKEDIKTKPVRDLSTEEGVAFISNITDKNYEDFDDLKDILIDKFAKGCIAGQEISVIRSMADDVIRKICKTSLGEKDYERLGEIYDWFDLSNIVRNNFRFIWKDLTNLRPGREQELYFLIGNYYIPAEDYHNSSFNYHVENNDLILVNQKGENQQFNISLQDVPTIDIKELDLDSVEAYYNLVKITPNIVPTFKKLLEFYDLGKGLRQKIIDCVPYEVRLQS